MLVVVLVGLIGVNSVVIKMLLFIVYGFTSLIVGRFIVLWYVFCLRVRCFC